MSKLEDLISAWLDGRLTEAETELLQSNLRDSEDARRLFQQYCHLDAVLRESATQKQDTIDPTLVYLGKPTTIQLPTTIPSSTWILSAAVGLLSLIVLIGCWVWMSRQDSTIARITGLSGPLRWTGDGGQVVHDLTVGTVLSGGTIDGLSPESWFRLEFNDGSQVTISGNAMLAFSDVGQKQLHLKSGMLSADVVEQPIGKPMLVHTRSATLTILGTSFEVEAGLSSTAVNVTNGQVQVERLSDRETISIPALHRVVAAADRDFSSQKVPQSTDRWKSQLDMGPRDSYGTWIPPTGALPAALKSIPYIAPHNQSETLYLIGIPLSKVEQLPVIVKSDSRFILRGRLTSEARLFFGITVTRPDGQFAGKFLSRTEDVIRPDGNFEVTFQLDSFELDPSVQHQASELPSRPHDLMLAGVWCFTKTGHSAGMEVTEVELIPAERTEVVEFNSYPKTKVTFTGTKKITDEIDRPLNVHATFPIGS